MQRRQKEAGRLAQRPVLQGDGAKRFHLVLYVAGQDLEQAVLGIGFGNGLRHHPHHVGFGNQVGGGQDGRGFNQALGRGRLLHPKLLLQHFAHGAAGGLQDPRVVEQAGEPDRFLLPQRVVHTHHHREFLVFQRRKNIVGPVPVAHPANRHVQHAVAQQFKQAVAGVQRDVNRQQRVGLFQGNDGLREQGRRRRHDAADRHPPGTAELQLRQLTRHGLDRAAHAAKVMQHAAAGQRQLLAAPDPLEQALAQRRLQLLDHFGGCRLRHAQLAGGLAQRAVFTDGQDQRHLPHAQAIQQLGNVRGVGHGVLSFY